MIWEFGRCRWSCSPRSGVCLLGRALGMESIAFLDPGAARVALCRASVNWCRRLGFTPDTESEQNQPNHCDRPQACPQASTVVHLPHRYTFSLVSKASTDFVREPRHSPSTLMWFQSRSEPSSRTRLLDPMAMPGFPGFQQNISRRPSIRRPDEIVAGPRL
jgi:hypothetical protein